jgi:transcriptional regulator GlxA family with amidase domain
LGEFTRTPHVSILALPESTATPIIGLYERLLLADPPWNTAPGCSRPFSAEVVGRQRGYIRTAHGVAVEVHRSLAEIDEAAIVVIPPIRVPRDVRLVRGHPEVAAWLRQMHARGAHLWSAGVDAWMLAEAGLLDGREATTYRAEQRLIVIAAGSSAELDMAGGGSSWEDLALALVARYAGPDVLLAPTNHDDAVVRDLQNWLRAHYVVSSPVDVMMRRSGLSRTSFKRRFKRATGYAPLDYVQRLRVEEAKRRLERSDDPIDEICWSIGYEEAPFFRRLFRRFTRLSPADYRRRVRRASVRERSSA